jgi:hypothetical protein
MERILTHLPGFPQELLQLPEKADQLDTHGICQPSGRGTAGRLDDYH